MSNRRFRLVDVFGDGALAGNPLAVVIDSEGLSTDQMLEVTRWLNFSETTFLSPPEDSRADYKVRIFSLSGELPFAGHPTLGSGHVWQSTADESKDRIVQECGAGLVELRRDENRFAFAAPPLLREGEVEEPVLDDLAAVLGVGRSSFVDAAWVDNGPGWVGVLLDSAATVLDLEPDFSRYSGDDSLEIGVVGFHPEGSETLYEVRAFFANQRGNLVEDPVTGSLNASVAQWLVGSGRASAKYLASQGTALGRSGRIHIERDGDTIWVGGQVFDIVDGQLGLFINGRR